MAKTVYGNYTQEDLDLEYDMRRRCPHFAETFAAMDVHNKRTISNFDCQLNVEFGKKPGEKLDIWPVEGDPLFCYLFMVVIGKLLIKTCSAL